MAPRWWWNPTGRDGMLRLVLFAIGVGMLIAASANVLPGWPTIQLAVFGAVLTLALLFERSVYKPIRPEPPGRGWEQTSERFIEPQSGQKVTVYFNPHAGARQYIGDGSR
jgi:membrane protein implicated in regulation of membrane protease activity